MSKSNNTSTSSQPKKKKGSKTKVAQKRAVKRTEAVDFGQALTDCAQEYAKLLANPFVRSHHACVPVVPAIPSRKFSVFSSGVFATQTSAGSAVNGYGFITFNPTAAAANDRICLTATNAGTAATSYPTSTFSGVSNFYSNSEYSTADLAPLPDSPIPGCRFRLVAAGLRMKYNGKFIETGGRVVGLEMPDHTSLNSTYGDSIDPIDYSASSQFLEAGQFDLGPDKWLGVVYTPVDSSEWSYGTFNDKTHGGVNYGNYLGFAIASATPGVSLLYEAYAHFEIIGRPVQGKTPSHSDSMGFSATQQAFTSVIARQPFQTRREIDNTLRARSFVQLAGRSLVNMIAPALPYVKAIAPYAAGAVGSFFGGPAGGLAASTATRLLTGPSSTSRQLMLAAAGS